MAILKNWLISKSKIERIKVLFYVILGVIEFFTINQLSSISFIILFYVLPILCTLVVSSVKSGKLLTKNLLSSILALVEYLVMGNLFNNLGLWSKFVARNSMKINNGEIQISNNMLSPLQIVFVIVLYFGVGYLIYYFAKKMKNRG